MLTTPATIPVSTQPPLGETGRRPVARESRRLLIGVGRYGCAALSIGLAHVIMSIAWRFTGPAIGPAITSVFLSAVIITSLYAGRGPGLLATFLATVDLDYTFATPYYSFSIVLDDVMWLIVFMLAAMLTSSLQAGRRNAEEALRAAHRDLEERVRERTAELVRSQEQFSLLVRDLLDISERERERIGHDLHDGLGQELTGIALLSTALAQQLESAGGVGRDEAEEVADLVHESIEHTRELARGLSPVDLESSGLESALRQLAKRVSRLPNVTCSLEADAVAVHAVIAAHLYRIAQEAISNALRHGQARIIAIRLRQSDDRLILSVTDNGAGFDSASSGEGMGLRLMAYRAKVIRASLTVQAETTGGTTVECCVEGPRTVWHE